VSIEILKQELAGLGTVERNQMVAFLLSLQDTQNDAYREKLGRDIDDKDPAHWVTLDELDRRLRARKDGVVE
jgi:hypothetical protein